MCCHPPFLLFPNLYKIKQVHILLALLVTQALALTFRPSDSGIVGPRYAQMLEQWEQWRKESGGWLEIAEYGESPQHRPLRLLILRKPGDFSTRTALLMTGNMHGGEYLQVEDRLPLELMNRRSKEGVFRRFFDRGGAIVAVPVVNPDGYDSRSRGNSLGKDLNRDWPLPYHKIAGFHEVETSALARALDALTGSPTRFDFRVTVDYHCCLGAVLYPWSNGQVLPPPELARHHALAQLASNLLNVEIGTTGQLLGYSPLGTAKDCYYEHFGATSFTFEGRERVEKNYLSQHLAWWETLVDAVMKEKKEPLLAKKAE